ncbi:MAG: NAD(P)/FAD-dependent oxidoreductase [Calditrichaeota bacterium]|nr:NAD(P)/FAD-dependent oxidoreductase [Calditrichota bacterium]
MKYVIIGAGVAGVTAAETIRKYDSDGEIVLIGKEQFLPYKRYLLTEFFCGTIEKENLFSFSCEDIKKLKINFRKGQLAKSINFEDKKVKLFHNETVSYDKLLIATGGKPRIGPALTPFAKNLQLYYSLEDILLIKEKLPSVHTCVVFGQGISTLDLMAGLNNLKKEVIYITKKPRAFFPLLQANSDVDIHQFLTEKGVKIITNDRPVSIEKEDGRFVVETLNGEKMIADLVFAWDDYRPNIKFLQHTKIDRKIGILVDEHLRTSVGDVYAAGDCTEIYHPKIKNYWINFGYPNAIEQGEVAGKNMTGLKEAYQIHETLVFHVLGKPFEARWWE